MKKSKRLIFAGIITLIIIALFLLSSYFTKIYLVQLKIFIQKYYLIGIITYLFLGTLDASGVPISNVPLIPVVVAGYGLFMGVVLTSIGWFLGSIIAFYIARKYGDDFIKKFIPLQKIESFQKYLPEKDFFISIIFFRIIMPHDFVNYGYGIFTKIKNKDFFISSIIGIVLSVFIYSMTNNLSMIYQVVVILFAIIIFYFIFYYYPTIKKRRLIKLKK